MSLTIKMIEDIQSITNFGDMTKMKDQNQKSINLVSTRIFCSVIISMIILISIFSHTLAYNPTQSDNLVNYQNVSTEDPNQLNSNLQAYKQSIQQGANENPRFGEKVKTIEGENRLRTITFSPSGRYLACGGIGGPHRLSDIQRIQIWDMVNLGENPLELMAIHNVESLTFSPDEKFLAAGGDPSITLWSVNNGEYLDTLRGSEDLSFQHIVFSKNGEEIFASANNGTMYVWDVFTREVKYQFEQLGREGHQTWYTARDIALSPDGSLVAFGAPNGSVFLWDTINKTLIKCQSHTALARCVAFSPDGKMLVSGSFSGEIRVWNLTSREELLAPINPPKVEGVISLSYSPNGTILASGHTFGEDFLGDKVVYLWDVRTWSIIKTMYTSNCVFVDYSPTGTVLASIGDVETEIDLWNVAETYTKIDKWQFQDKTISSLAFGNKALMALSRGNAVIELWNRTTRSLIHNLTGYTISVLPTPITFSPDGQWLVSGGGDDIIRFWNTTSGENQYSLTSHESSVTSVAFSPNNRWLASGDGQGGIKLWNITNKASMQLYRNFSGHLSVVTTLSFSPDSQILASSEYLIPNVLLWNIPTGTVNSSFLGHTDRITSLDFSPNGDWLVSGSLDETCRLLNLHQEKCQEVRTSGKINTLLFSPDGIYFVTGSLDGIIQFWNVSNGILRATLIEHKYEILDLMFSKNGFELISGSVNSTIISFDLDPPPFDGDQDGMLDIWESEFGLDPTNYYDSFSDSDGDGLVNIMEFLPPRTDPTDTDSDDDTLPDLWEFLFNTNPRDDDGQEDSDQDGLSNWFEYEYDLNGLINDSFRDPDGDGLSNWVEFDFGSWPNQSDSDNDGMPDWYEYQNSKRFGESWIGLFPDLPDSTGDLDGDGMSNLWEFQMKLNASKNDALEDKDKDGMTNIYEYLMHFNATNPTDAAIDTDSDGIPNLWEFQWNLNATNPIDGMEDKDGDGMPNFWEYQMGLDATAASDATLDKDGDGIPNLGEYQNDLLANDSTDAALDADSDGMSNLWEYQMGLDIYDASDADLDLDGDGMSNYFEYKYSFNATDLSDAAQDADRDGISNKAEYFAKTDPRNFWSFPLISLSVIHLIIIIFGLVVTLSSILFLFVQSKQRGKLVAKFNAPDYEIALRIRNAGLSNYEAFLYSEAEAKTVLDEATTAKNQGDLTAATQKYREALKSFEQLSSLRYTAEIIFYLAQISKLKGTLSDDNPILQRFPSSPYDDSIVAALAFMLEALLAEIKKNWGEAEEKWKNASQVEDLDSDFYVICQEALAESSFRTWFNDQSYQNLAQVNFRLNTWQKTAETDSHKGSLCSVFLLRARLALASYQFNEVEQWLGRCQFIAEEAGLSFYRDLSHRETQRLLQHKERIELLFKADKFLSSEDRGKLLQQYIKKAVLSMERIDSMADEGV